MDVGQSRHHESIDIAEKMTGGDALFQIEAVEELTLVRPLPAHHRFVLQQITGRTESWPTRTHNRVFQRHRSELVPRWRPRIGQNRPRSGTLWQRRSAQS